MKTFTQFLFRVALWMGLFQIASLHSSSLGVAFAQSIVSQDADGKVPAPNAGRIPLGKVDAAIGQGGSLANPVRGKVERDFIPVTLPPVLDSVFVDVAELIVTVSTEYDSTEPLLIAAFPATAPAEARPTSWSANWDEMSGGFDPQFLGLTSMLATKSEVEIRIDITSLVRRWQNGDAPKYGIVLKSLSENKSTFHWIRDGRYNGADAKLELHYSRI